MRTNARILLPVAILAVAACSRKRAIRADVADASSDAADVGVEVSVDAGRDAEELVPPSHGLTAKPALGPYATLADACDALIASCSADSVSCSCAYSRATSLPEWILVEGDSDEESAHLRIALSTSLGIWVSRDGARAGTLWAANGDGYWEQVVRAKSARTGPDGIVHGEGLTESFTCYCCRSTHPRCAGQKPSRDRGDWIDFVAECRLAGDGRPWCFLAEASRGTTVKASVVRIVGDTLETDPWSTPGQPSRHETIWFP